ncbi:MAG TPA: efflux transporter outer membrane subunit [Candidatus Acidoferrales bacterium]|nr:efflux transporter outer membrane subunit [Candidatus Acidoferrales bacterium]
MKLERIFVAAIAALGLGACSLEPVYERPPAPVAGTYPAGPAYQQTTGGTAAFADEIGWRDFLTDPRLQRLVQIALANNRDLRVQALYIAQAQAQYRIQRSNLLPQVAAGASETASRSVSNITRQNVTTRVDDVGVSLSTWELDFFGRLQSLDHAALQQYFATAQARKAFQIALVAQVADQYLTLLADDDLIVVTQHTLETAQQSYNLMLLQFNTGTANEESLSQAQTIVEQAKANYAAQVRTRAQDENTLVLLLGAPLPADLPSARPLNSQSILADIPAGLPSDLLMRRPDIMESEANLRGANANIGAARAAFFPSITLTGGLGTESAALSGLFGGGSLAWSYVPSITVPIFEGGRLRANLDVATVQKDINVAQYEKSIQTAFQEVANDLAARGTYDDQVAALERYVAASQRYLDIAQQRFRGGVDSYLNVLTAQTSLYTAQQLLVTARLQRLTTLVSLYRDLGGGWIEHTGDAPAPAENIGSLAPHNDASWNLMQFVRSADTGRAGAP